MKKTNKILTQRQNPPKKISPANGNPIFQNNLIQYQLSLKVIGSINTKETTTAILKTIQILIGASKNVKNIKSLILKS